MYSTYTVSNVRFDVYFNQQLDYEPNITTFKESIIFDYPCGNDTNCSPYSFILQPGIYKFEVWGAQGGRGTHEDTLEATSGGYSLGIINLKYPTLTYVFVGGKGVSNGAGGYNGGGYVQSDSYSGGSGGGATDIRLINDSLYHRVIVAGGSAGTEFSNHPNIGGYGGGLEGSRGGGDYPQYAGYGGTQLEGGSQGVENDEYSENGEFGYGGNVTYGQRGAGGGGWYGGGSGGEHGDGGGGSGFVFTSYTKSSTPRDYQLGKNYMLNSCVTLSGREKQPSPYNYQDVITHLGPGVARITVISTQPKCFCSDCHQFIDSILLFIFIL